MSATTDVLIVGAGPTGLALAASLATRGIRAVDSAPEHPDIEYVQALLDGRGPERERFIVNEVVWGSRFRIAHRVADTYRTGRILLAGDAAHVHSPTGGQGMNTGIQDAMALATALISGNEEPLSAHGAIRRPVAREVVVFTDRLTRLATVGRQLRPLRNGFLRFLALIPSFRRQLAGRLSGLVYR